MYKNLVIVESPAKAKTIEKFLGKDFKVMSSYGHIRDLKKRELSVNKGTLLPEYEIPDDKQKLVKDLRTAAKVCQTVWLASDEDREGEAISWHLCEVMGLDAATTNRIVFHEITKPAILAAIEKPRRLDMNLVNAQQARRVLDRIVGFKLSPVLWRKVKPALSAGRVQSEAVRLIVERQREIQAIESESYYRLTALFHVHGVDMKADLSSRFKTREEAQAFLSKCKKAEFVVSGVSQKPLKRTPAPPFTTSTLQQEAARKLGFTVAQTMTVAQHLYENGLITYMRTDSVNLSSLCLNSAKTEIERLWGAQYCKMRQYHTNAKGAQEAHEAIRPTYMDNIEIDGSVQEKRLYDLIWKRTVASQMADAQIEKTIVTINITGPDNNDIKEQFVATGEVVTFDGFLKVYRESVGDDEAQDETLSLLPQLAEGEMLCCQEITATERYSQCPLRYTEASLVHKLEELGIGRPSTYAPTISTIQQREYVLKGDKEGTLRNYTIDTLKRGRLTSKTKTETIGHEKGKLLPTDVGGVVNDFLMKHFPSIMDFNFTARVEQQFDTIAEGKAAWTEMIKEFCNDFNHVVEEALQTRDEHKAGERELGMDPASGQPVYVKIGRFGPMVQIGRSDDAQKPRFAQIPPDKSLNSMTLEEALELFRLPREVGQFEGKKVSIGAGRFGPYVLHDGKYVSIPKGHDPLTITLKEAVELIDKKRAADRQRHLRMFEEDPLLEVLNGRYGPYLMYNGENYRLPKAMHERATSLSYEECMEIVNNNGKAAARSTKGSKRK